MRIYPSVGTRVGFWWPTIHLLIILILVGGWPTPLKNMKVSWDDEIPNIWQIKAMLQTTNQIQIIDVVVSSDKI